MTDELDKAITSLKKPTKKVSSNTALIPDTAAAIVWKEAETVEDSIGNTAETISQPYPNIYENHRGVKDTYLPHVLCLLDFFKLNHEARHHIRTHGILLNGKVTYDVDATTESSNFIIQWGDKEYQIFKI